MTTDKPHHTSLDNPQDKPDEVNHLIHQMNASFNAISSSLEVLLTNSKISQPMREKFLSLTKDKLQLILVDWDKLKKIIKEEK